jgi:outer membrane lipoprotein SlyB
MMRALLAGLSTALILSGAALAAEAQGHIAKIDAEKLTITLDDGNSYKLPGEFDLSSIREGMEVLIAYDTIDGDKLITDMQLPE